MVVVVVVLVLVVVVVVVVGGGGLILGEVKARPKDIISFSLDYISKSKVQTSNPSSSPIPLDTPARPADFHPFSTKSVKIFGVCSFHCASTIVDILSLEPWVRRVNASHIPYESPAPF